jgi:hypothetical protein
MRVIKPTMNPTIMFASLIQIPSETVVPATPIEAFEKNSFVMIGMRIRLVEFLMWSNNPKS